MVDVKNERVLVVLVSELTSKRIVYKQHVNHAIKYHVMTDIRRTRPKKLKPVINMIIQIP